MGAILLAAGALGWIAAYPRTLSTSLDGVATNYQVLAILLIPGVAAFTFGGASVGLALGCAASAWAGVGLRNFTQATVPAPSAAATATTSRVSASR
jgi:hypothetical protein